MRALFFKALFLYLTLKKGGDIIMLEDNKQFLVQAATIFLILILIIRIVYLIILRILQKKKGNISQNQVSFFETNLYSIWVVYVATSNVVMDKFFLLIPYLLVVGCSAVFSIVKDDDMTLLLKKIIIASCVGGLLAKGIF